MQHPLLRIRKEIFGLSQKTFADALGIDQSRISRWEREEGEPSRKEMSAIRQLAAARKLTWNDSWFFELPETAA